MKGVLKRLESDMDAEDVKMLQICLELLTESDILPNGNFSHYTENVFKDLPGKSFIGTQWYC